MEDDRESLRLSMVKELRHILDQANSYAQAYRRVRDTYIQNNAPNMSFYNRPYDISHLYFLIKNTGNVLNYI
jgi:hypothetical protein